MRSERKAAKLDGGHVVLMSGAGKQKGDVLTATWLIEDKLTEVKNGEPAKSFSVTVDMLRKTEREAIASHRLPQWRIALPGYTVRMLREEDYLYLQAMAAKAEVE